MNFKSFLFSILLLSATVHALPLKEYADVNARELIAMNEKNLGNLDLEEFIQQIQNVNFLAMVNKNSIMGDRESAYYLENKVYSLGNYQVDFTEAIKMLANHESMGALGYDDKNYEKSILMGILKDLNEYDREQLKDTSIFKDQFLLNEDLQIHQEGGATGIGGGGDINAAWFKYTLINAMLINKFPLTIDRTMLIFNYAFEPSFIDKDGNHDILIIPNLSVTPTRFNVHMDSLIHREIHNIDFIILVPRNFIKMDPKKQLSIVGELSEFMGMHLDKSKPRLGLNIDKRKTIAVCHNRELKISDSMMNHKYIKSWGGIKYFIEPFQNRCMRELGINAIVIEENLPAGENP